MRTSFVLDTTFKKSAISALLVVLLAVFADPQLASAATNIWSAASGIDTNWSNPNNWTNITTLTAAAPVGGDDVKFLDAGTNTSIGVPTSLVDGGFGGYIGSLQIGPSANFHTIVIADGVTLNVTNAPSLPVLAAYSPTDVGIRNLTNTITGTNGTLNVNNPAAVIAINQATASATSGTTPNRSTLDMSGLGTFMATVNRMGIGSSIFSNSIGSGNNRCGGQLILARTNFITLGFSDTLANYMGSGRTNAIELSRNGNNPSIVSVLLLGLTNVIYLDSIGCGLDKSGNNSTPASGVVAFNPAFTSSNPVAYFRGKNGGATDRVTWWSIGDGNASASSSNGGRGTNDFSNGTVDILANVMSLGRDCNAGTTWAVGPHSGVLTFTAGTVDVNTLYIANQAFNQPSSAAWCGGNVNVKGVNATLRVNTTLTLGNTTSGSGVVAVNTAGALNITDGTVYANNITVGALSTTNVVRMTNATLIVSNTLATNASGLFALNMTNSTLGLRVPTDGSRVGLVKTLAMGGATNLVQLASTPAIFSTYPTQVPLIKYTAGWSGTNIIGLASIPLWAPGATLVSNGLNATSGSLDLSLPIDPRPVFTLQPVGFSGFPSNDLTLATTISPNTVTVGLHYQWYTNNSSTPLTDGANGDGSTYSGVNTGTLLVLNCQTNNSGNYTLVVTNIYGAATSSVAVLSISTNDIPPVIAGVAPGTNQTVIQNNTALFTISASGAPAPDYHWYDNNNNPIPSATTATLTLNAVQYSQLGAYSVIVSNRAGTAATNMFLNVIVPPNITTQPTNLVVVAGSPAAFSVTATGVPTPGYQWLKNGNPITGNASALTANLVIAAAAGSNIGNYSVTATNAAGTSNSVTVSLTVNSPMSVTTLKPANNASGVCYDTPLYITFDQPSLTRNAGTIKIYNSTNSATPVDTIDMSLNAVFTQVGTGLNPYPLSGQQRTIGGNPYVTFPVFLASYDRSLQLSNTAVIYPHEGVMTSNQTYYVTIDSGVFTDTNGAHFPGITDTNAWRFTTKPVGPAPDTNYVVVATDGTADFCTVQGAVDFFPNATNVPNRVIFVRKGNCVEIVSIPPSKNNITLRGESRQDSKISYPNSNIINPGSHAVMVLHVRANNIAIENLKLTNSVPQGGSQSFALMVETGARRFIAHNVDIDSYQDTILVNTSDSTAYYSRSLIQGDVDFIWGGGNCFFTNCEIRALRTGSVLTQPRTAAGSNGMSFVNCAITRGSTSFTNSLLARAIGVANGNVVFAQCRFDTNAFTGWTASDLATPSLNLRWWEYSNSNLDATASVAFNGTHLSATDPNTTNALSSSLWFYDSWVPQLLPNILTNPASLSVAGGAGAGFSVTATGVPDPTYQWLKNGSPIAGETNATLSIAAAHAGDVAQYSVIVSNLAGAVTTTAASLQVGNSAPSLAAIANYTNNVGVTVSVNPMASDPDVPAQTLTFSLLSGPSTTFDTGTGAYTWRPQATDSGSVNTIQIQVTDNGTPNLSNTKSFIIAVNPLTQPNVTTQSFSGGLFSMTVAGQTGPDYEIRASTNLTDWVSINTNISPAMPFNYTDPDTGSFPIRFYRIVVGPPVP